MRVLLLVLVVAAAAAAHKNLPSTWKKCSKKDPQINACLLNAMTVALADLEDGVKDLGVLPIDPMLLTQVDIEQGTGSVSLDLHFYDLLISGMAKTYIQSVESDVENIYFRMPVTVPGGINLKGRYKINGKVLVMPVNGEGDSELQLDNVTTLATIRGSKYTKDGLTYGNITEFKVEFNTTRLTIRLDNLFNGNKELSDNMNVFMNENWMEILNEIKPTIQDAFGAAYREILNRIFSRVPYDTLYDNTLQF